MLVYWKSVLLDLVTLGQWVSSISIRELERYQCKYHRIFLVHLANMMHDSTCPLLGDCMMVTLYGVCSSTCKILMSEISLFGNSYSEKIILCFFIVISTKSCYLRYHWKFAVVIYDTLVILVIYGENICANSYSQLVYYIKINHLILRLCHLKIKTNRTGFNCSLMSQFTLTQHTDSYVKNLVFSIPKVVNI